MVSLCIHRKSVQEKVTQKNSSKFLYRKYGVKTVYDNIDNINWKIKLMNFEPLLFNLMIFCIFF